MPVVATGIAVAAVGDVVVDVVAAERHRVRAMRRTPVWTRAAGGRVL
jgi:hypothetical protein